MCPARNSRSRQGSQAQGSGRRRGRRGAPSHNQNASRNSRNEQGHQNLETLPPSGHPLLPAPTIIQYNVHTHLTVEGIDQLLQLQSSTGYVVDDVFVATSSVMTRTGSTESYIMEYGLSMEPYTPASEPPEPWPYHPGSHHLDNVGAQFASEYTGLPVTDDGLGDPTAIQEESSSYPPVMVVANDGKAEVFDIAGLPDLDNPSIASFNQAELLPSDPSKAYLASLPDEAWLRPIPLGVPRALTFPLLGQYNVDVNEDLVSRLACVCVFLECVC
jgi:hypothetical protein